MRGVAQRCRVTIHAATGFGETGSGAGAVAAVAMGYHAAGLLRATTMEETGFVAAEAAGRTLSYDDVLGEVRA